MKLRVASRESRLAVIQSQQVMETLARLHPELELELVTMKTTGDRILDRTLDQIGGKGLFVRELDEALRTGRADLSVHSCKDLPMEEPADLPLLAFSRREDPRDVLVLPQGVQTLDLTRPVGCASLRRTLQFQALYPQAKVEPVRGNVLTRLRKLDEGQFSALILAAAGLRRWCDKFAHPRLHRNPGWSECPLPPGHRPPWVRSTRRPAPGRRPAPPGRSPAHPDHPARQDTPGPDPPGPELPGFPARQRAASPPG